MYFDLSVSVPIINVGLGYGSIGLSLSVHYFIILVVIGFVLMKKGWKRIRRKR